MALWAKLRYGFVYCLPVIPRRRHAEAPLSLRQYAFDRTLPRKGPCPHAGKQTHHQEQDHRAKEGDNETSQSETSKSTSKAEHAGQQVREHQATKEGTKDADDDVAEQAHARALYDLASEPPRRATHNHPQEDGRPRKTHVQHNAIAFLLLDRRSPDLTDLAGRRSSAIFCPTIQRQARIMPLLNKSR